MLAPLGPWGMLAFAAVDGSFLGMPLDPIFVGYVYAHPSQFLLYVLLGSLGSALGSIVIYVIGYTGGEVLLRKRLSPERFEKIHESFDRHEFWALMFPAMLPPPAPFKIVVLAAAAFEMNFCAFSAGDFSGTVRALSDRGAADALVRSADCDAGGKPFRAPLRGDSGGSGSVGGGMADLAAGEAASVDTITQRGRIPRCARKKLQ